MEVVMHGKEIRGLAFTTVASIGPARKSPSHPRLVHKISTGLSYRAVRRALV